MKAFGINTWIMSFLGTVIIIGGITAYVNERQDNSSCTRKKDDEETAIIIHNISSLFGGFAQLAKDPDDGDNVRESIGHMVGSMLSLVAGVPKRGTSDYDAVLDYALNAERLEDHFTRFFNSEEGKELLYQTREQFSQSCHRLHI